MPLINAHNCQAYKLFTKGALKLVNFLKQSKNRHGEGWTIMFMKILIWNILPKSIMEFSTALSFMTYSTTSNFSLEPRVESKSLWEYILASKPRISLLPMPAHLACLIHPICLNLRKGYNSSYYQQPSMPWPTTTLQPFPLPQKSNSSTQQVQQSLNVPHPT